MMNLIFNIFLFIGNTWGESGSSCQGADSVVRLDDEMSDPLYHHPVQDQDGLGTCYGNALSLALKTVLPGAPDVSYLDISVQDNLFRPMHSGFVSKDGILFNSGGVVSSSFEQLKQKGYCPQSSFPLENDLYHPLYPLDPGVQSQALKSVGEFLDLSRSGKTIDSIEVKSYLEKMGPLAQQFSLAARARCAQDFSALKYIYKMMTTPAEDLSTRKELLQSEIAELRTQQSQLFSGSSDQKIKEMQAKSMEIYQAIKEKQKQILELELVATNGGLTGELEQLPGSFFVEYNLLLSKYSAEKSDHRKSEMKAEGEFIAAFNKLTSQYGVQLTIPTSFSDLSLFTILHDDLERSLPGPCFKRKFKELVFSEEAASEILNCPNLSPKYRALLEVLGLSQQVDSIIDTFKQSTTKLPTITQHADLFLSLFAPQCLSGTDSQRVALPADLTLRPIDLESRPYPQSFDVSTKEVSSRLVDSLGAGKAMIFEICSDVLANPSADTHYAQSSLCEQQGEHRYHAIAATGYKCQGGKFKVLLQNSWGNTCTVPETISTTEPLAKCDYETFTDPTGQVIERPSGKIWIDAEQLVKNSRKAMFFGP